MNSDIRTGAASYSQIMGAVLIRPYQFTTTRAAMLRRPDARFPRDVFNAVGDAERANVRAFTRWRLIRGGRSATSQTWTPDDAA